MRYQIQQRASRRFVVLDRSRGTWTRGRFHTRSQAKEWVDEEERRRLLVIIRGDSSGMPGRSRAYLITDRDYAGTNERRILLNQRSH